MLKPEGQNVRDFEPPNPAMFRDDLSVLYQVDQVVPSEVDAAVLGMAERHFATHRRRRLVLRTVAGSLATGAVAASIVLVVWLARGWEQPKAMPGRGELPVAGVVAREDLDGNSRIDIRDAFLLARRLAMGESPKRQWDLNGDGKVDRADVDAIALAAVRLDEGTIQ